MTACKRILLLLLGTLVSSVSADPMTISQYPLFLTHKTIPNVLVVYDNSESMDGTMAGKLIAGDDPTTRGNIARSVLRNTVNSFGSQFNWGLETFAIGGAGLYSTYPYWLGNEQTMLFTDDCVGGVSVSNNGLRCIANPQWDGSSVGDSYVTYDRASDDPDINDVLYIGYFGAGAGFLIITLLSLFGFQDLNEINALKVVSTTMANGVAFLIFVFDRQVVWRYCLLAMITCAIGGYTSASLARKIPQTILRASVVAIGLGMAAWFFWKQS